MNIFVLDSDLRKCAEYHCDKHVVKMILESAQLLSSACRLSGLDEGYKLTHQNHPCAVWTRQSEDNFLWLADLAHFLNEEYKARFNHSYNHKSFDLIETLSLPNLPKIGLTEHPKCMPVEYKKDSVIESYRHYYRVAKAPILTYNYSERPSWL
jgi:hypothetical protein